LVVESGKVVVDRLKSRPGRGAYVHPRAACIRKSLDPKLLGFRFRAKGQSIEFEDLKILFAELQIEDV
jgi:predicted RNA-binding protein YlxR (DUF448 family)